MQIIQNNKKKLIGIAIAIIFLLGFMARPAFDNEVDKINRLRNPEPVVYQRQDSEYEKLRKEAYSNPEMQKAFDSLVNAYIEKQNIDKADKAKMEAQDKYSQMSLTATQEMAKAKGHADAILNDLLATVPQVEVK